MEEKRILECIGYPALLEQLAEECAELGKAALKLARIVRRENPTPVTKEEALENLREEYTDVIQCARELVTDFVTMTTKKERFFERLENYGKARIKE